VWAETHLKVLRIGEEEERDSWGSDGGVAGDGPPANAITWGFIAMRASSVLGAALNPPLASQSLREDPIEIVPSSECPL
jgi:hypothetical protein